jgi:uncharacterized protein YuzE
MRISVDREANAAYLRFEQGLQFGRVKKTHICDVVFAGGSVHLDVDSEGRLVGIEILGVTNVLSPEALDRLEGNSAAETDP